MGNTKNLTTNENISELEYLLYQIKEPIVCVKCSDEFENGLSAINNGRARNNIRVKDPNIQEEARLVRPILLVVSVLLDNSALTSSPMG